MKFLHLITFAFSLLLGSHSRAAEIFVIPGTTTLLLLGETSASDVGALQEAVRNEQIDTIVLKGPGGDLEAAFAMADFIIENQLATVVPKDTDCASACSLIFLAGAKRTLEENARLGFHLPFISKNASVDQYISLCQILLEDTRGWVKHVQDLSNWPNNLGFDVTVSSDCAVGIYQMGLRDIRRLNELVERDGISERVMDMIINTMPEDMTWVDVPFATELGIVSVSGEPFKSQPECLTAWYVVDNSGHSSNCEER